jgi:hypothetical protein
MRKLEQDKDPSSENQVAMKTVYLMTVKKIGSCRIKSKERSKRDVNLLPTPFYSFCYVYNIRKKAKQSQKLFCIGAGITSVTLLNS